MPMEISGGRSSQFQPTITFVEDTPKRIRRIDLNTAGVKDLLTLPGIGEATARRIVEAREKRAFTHVADLSASGLVSRRTLERIQKLAGVGRNATPLITDVSTDPERVLYERPFKLAIDFSDSASGVALVHLQADSISHALNLTREVTDDERREERIVFELPSMAAGVMNVQVSLYDAAGHKDHLARTLHIYHNPPFVIFYPSERSLRIANGAAQKKADGNFHCNSNFYFYNGTDTRVTLNRTMSWHVFSQSGSVLDSGTWDWGSSIVLAPWEISTGWWFTIAFPPGNATFNKLQAREQIRIEWRFTQSGTGASVSDSLTWRTVMGPHVNIIRVGEENFTNTERNRIFNALRSNAGSIYQGRDLDIGTIRTFVISVAEAGGYVTINSNGEAEDLTEDWTVPNDAIDMFVVRSYVGSVAGLSPRPGPCDKNAKGMNGTVVELVSSQAVLGIIMAHELGHYLGLPHINDANNLMRPTASTSNTLLNSSQGNTMRGHCFSRILA